MSFQSILSTEIDLLEDSDEEKEFKRDLLLICVPAGEYLSAKKEITACYVRERIEWEKHIPQLAEEGPEALLRMYRMEYSSFMKLCAIRGPKILVNDEMAQRRTGKDALQLRLCFIVYWDG